MFTRASSFIRSNRRPRSTQPRVVCSCFRINSFSSPDRHQNIRWTNTITITITIIVTTITTNTPVTTITLL